jgi:predicted dehydrogenase
VENLSGEKLKVAVVGLGKMGLLHASILNVLPKVELAALCDKSIILVKSFRKIFGGVHIVNDVRKLSDLDLDVVYVTTSIFSHSLVAKNVYLKGIARNLFVEKTLASSYKESKELCELAQRFGGANMVGYMNRFAVTFMKAKDLLTQESLGEVISFEAYAYSSDFLGSDKNSKTSSSRGGCLRDLGCHAVDLALWFFGDFEADPTKLQSVTENSAHFRVKKSNGLEGGFNVSQCMENYRLPEIGLVVRGSKGVMSVNGDKVDLKLNGEKPFTWYRHDLDDNVFFWLGASEYFREDKYFVKSVLEGGGAEPSFYTASKVDYIIDQVRSGAGRNE